MDSSPPLPLALEESIASLRQSIPELDSVLAPLIGSSSSSGNSGNSKQVTLDELLESTTDPLDRAKLIVSLGFALHSCLHAFLRVNGQDTSAAPIKAQVERLKMYFGKVKKAESKKNRPKTDVAAAGRFIQHAMSSSDRGSSPAMGRESSVPHPSSDNQRGASSPANSGSGSGRQQRPAFKPRGRR